MIEPVEITWDDQGVSVITQEREEHRRQHGTNSCYAAGCRLPECRNAHNEYLRERRMGYQRLVDAYPFAELLRSLTLPAMTIEDVSRKTGVPITTLTQLRDGQRRRIQERTAAKLSGAALLPSETDV